MKTRMIAKTGKRIVTIMLSLMMVAGVFAGVKLDVKAARTYTAGSNLIEAGSVKAGDIIAVPKPTNGSTHEIYVTIYNPRGNLGKSLWAGPTSKEEEIEVTKGSWENKEYKNYKVVQCTYEKEFEYGNYKWKIYLQAVDEGEVVPTEVVSGNESQGSVSVAETPKHICSFQWVTTIDPTTGADGLEEYKCAGCGLVKESHPIPASVAAVKDFYGNIKEAPENGSITYDSGKLYTISDYLLKKMSERNDVSVTVNFEYQNAKYELTFPVGTDYTSVLTDEEIMYGYFGVAAKLGLTVVAK